MVMTGHWVMLAVFLAVSAVHTGADRGSFTRDVSATLEVVRLVLHVACI